jgi:metal-responsive CopG/Arc/MetJ family transcriptional regulator
MPQINIATLTIMVQDRHNNVAKVNKILTDFGYLIIARLGVSLERHCLKNCTGLICLVLEGTKKELDGLAKKLNSVSGTKAKVTYLA